MFDELERIQDHLALEEKTAAEIQSVKMKTSIWPGEYKVGIFLFKLISLVGWVLIVIGLIMTIKALFNLDLENITYMENNPMPMLAVISALSTAFAGLLFVGYGQLARSIMENTNNTREILEIIRSSQAQLSSD